MKRLFGLIMFILIMYAVYYDLSRGTLPISTETTIKAVSEEITIEEEETEIQQDFFEKEVQSGETVLSIIETQLDSSIPVSIQQVVEDFEMLNKEVEAEAIQTGETYKFPDYRKLVD